MMGFINLLQEAQFVMVQLAIILCDLVGMGILVITVCKSAARYFKHNHRVRLMLAQGISLALGFKLGGEVLRTVTVRDFNEFAILGAIIVLRAAITLLIHWEIKADRADFSEDLKIKNHKLGRLRYIAVHKNRSN